MFPLKMTVKKNVLDVIKSLKIKLLFSLKLRKMKMNSTFENTELSE